MVRSTPKEKLQNILLSHAMSGCKATSALFGIGKSKLFKSCILKDNQYDSDKCFIFFNFMHFCPETMTTHAESMNSDLQRGLDRRLRRTQH